MPHKFDPARRARLEDPDRLRLLPARDLLIDAGVQAGMSVADVGCGPGFFTLPAAALVGPSGRIYALDITPEMLLAVQEKARGAGLGNIEAVLSEESAIPLPDAVAQFALVAFVLHEAVRPDVFLGEVVRLLAPGGRVLLLEWKKEEMPMGPPIDDRLTPQEAEGWLVRAGLRIERRFEPNAHHYGLIGQTP
jgi:ubiquinone/menaquinone biosynthesis C-methylase UbiE